MPEGPSIVLLKEQIQGFIGHPVINVRGNSKAGIDKIEGTSIKGIHSWGKHLLISLSNDLTVKIHFMLFGSSSVNEKKQNRNERLGIDLDNGEINFYACSVKFLEGDLNELYDWSSDVMSDSWNAALAFKKIKQHEGELICDVLLDQEIFSGVGNIIKNEVLFRKRINPESLTGKIPKNLIKAIIQDSRDYSFQFLEWKRAFVLKKNYQVHTKKICPRCNIPLIKKQHLGSRKRRAFFCGNCQHLYI